MTSKRPTNLPHGRWQGDFPRLSNAEKKLIAHCARGEWFELGAEVPEKATAQNRIRAELIRFLLLGGDDKCPMHERGVRIAGAWIEGTIDLDEIHAIAPLTLGVCRLAKFSARDAYLPSLMLRGSHVESLSADRVEIATTVFLDRGFKATGEVRIPRARIGASLHCGAGTFSNVDGNGVPVGNALTADGADIRGGVFLDNGFRADGEVRFLGANIVGDFYCDYGTFRNENKDLILRSFNACSIRVTGALFMRDGKFTGIVDFSAADVGSLVDDADCWPDGNVMIDGFRYDRISSGATDAEARIVWLKRQYPRHLVDDFKPQPWEQAIKVLREMGHPFEARQIAIEKQRVWRRSWQRGMWHWPRIFIALPRWILHKAYGGLAAYGYRPMWTVWWMIGVCLCCYAVFYCAGNAGLFGPSSAIIQTAPGLANCGVDPRTNTAHWTDPGCKLPPEYSTFHPLIYSLDVILPLVDLHQEQEWGPILLEGQAGFSPASLLRYLIWFEILFGWVTSLLLVAVLGRLVEKD